MTVAPCSVVEHFNIIEDIGSGQIPGFVYSLPDAFFFQRIEERFGHRIIPAVATQAHARGQVIGSTEALPVVAAVLTAVRMHDNLAVRFSSPHGHMSASSVSSRERVGFIDQPTTFRAKRPMTTARDSQPCQVRM